MAEAVGIIRTGNIHENPLFPALKRLISGMLAKQELRSCVSIKNGKIHPVDKRCIHQVLVGTREKILAKNSQAEKWLPQPLGTR